jgi:hypothetical protein
MVRSRKEKTLDRIVRAFADSVGEFDFDAAEGWFATARLQSGRAASHGHPRGTNQGVSRRVRRSA